MLPIKTILHPTDFSELSDAAFRLACALAQDHGGRLVVVHVSPPQEAGAEAVPGQPPAGDPGGLRQALERLRPPDPGLPVEHRLEQGDAAEAILRLAREYGADLIVMGTHGRTGLRRLLMGSVAEQVMRAAPCPVLTINRPFPKVTAPG